MDNEKFCGQLKDRAVHHLSKGSRSAHAVRNFVLCGNLVTQMESEDGICVYHSIHIINADQTRQNRLAYRPVIQESAGISKRNCKHDATVQHNADIAVTKAMVLASQSSPRLAHCVAFK